jgi:SOS response regulatory protein OraA/RecX
VHGDARPFGAVARGRFELHVEDGAAHLHLGVRRVDQEPLVRPQLGDVQVGTAAQQRETLRRRRIAAFEHALCVERYLGSGLLNDARFAKNLASQLTRRGKSSRVISQKLAMRGVPSEVASELMTARRQDEPGAELEAALAYVRKRRLGPYRPSEARVEYRQKDLASLARQGFSFDLAKQALGEGPSSDEEL